MNPVFLRRIARACVIIAVAASAASCGGSSPDDPAAAAGGKQGLQLAVTRMDMTSPDGRTSVHMNIDEESGVIRYQSLSFVDVRSLIPGFDVAASYDGVPVAYSVTSDGAEVRSGKTEWNMRLPRTLTLQCTADGRTFAREYRVEVCHLNTGLPVIYFDTDSGRGIGSKEWWVDCTFTVDGRGVSDDVAETKIRAKGRGNVSWTRFLKKSYSLRFDSRTGLLGMPKHKRWCLIGNYRDKTLMRNMAAMELGACTDLKWNPRYVQAELVYNGVHVGTYMLSENIRIDKNRVAINEMTPEQTSLPDISGGYILEWEQYDDPDKHMTVMPHTGRQMYVKSPDLDDGNQAQFRYITSYMTDIENMLYAASQQTDAVRREEMFADIFGRYIDAGSFADVWMVYEITGTPDFSVPRSHYMYKDMDDPKVYAGPLWDFDCQSFVPANSRRWVNREAVWYAYLFKSSAFRRHVKERWMRYRDSFYEVLSFIDREQSRLRWSAQLNWEITDLSLTNENTNGDEYISSAEAIARMRKALEDKLDWMDVQIASY